MAAEDLIATVAIAAPLDKPLSYRVPQELRPAVRVGVRLRVPLGKRQAIGYLLSLAEGEGEGLKAVREVLDTDPLFAPELIPFFRQAAQYYRHPLGDVIRAALPAGLSGRGGQVAILRERVFTPGKAEGTPPGARQREVLAWVRERGRAPLSQLRESFPSPYQVLQRLVTLGFLEESEEERRRDPFLDLPVAPDVPPAPSPEQTRALQEIEAAHSSGRFAPLLLHGITGSGKTEVYLRAIEDALSRGKRALVLVPEIALTPQLVGRFRARFAGRETAIAVLHSGLSDGERYDAWRAIARGEVDIVIGARSAVFAPQRELGIIVVDEEHESSYKQAEGFRYHARDLALLRGQLTAATVVLGSATPALTTFHRAVTGRTGYLPLSGRVRSRCLPRVELLDLSETSPEGLLAPALLEALEKALAQGEQVLLLLNRRGFAPFLLCADCGATFRCPNCEITLTFHRGRRRLVCHYCDHAVSPPEACPHCQGADLQPEGAGTERLEDEIGRLFPKARVARMDRDTTARKGAHQQLVTAMAGGDIDILVGTQMVAKGHDFPAVTLVGVLGTDNLLNFPDFRSAERTFALLTQVAGRAGRGERPGRVLIQTYAPDHYAVVCAAAQDYRGFYEQEAAARQALGFPPFGFLVNLVFSGNDLEKVNAAAEDLSGYLRQRTTEVEVLGPAPCPLARLRGKSRVQVLLKAPSRSPLRRLLAGLDSLPRPVPAGVQLAVDVDPVDML